MLMVYNYVISSMKIMSHNENITHKRKCFIDRYEHLLKNKKI